ncbi:MAG: ribosomal-protein-serine N-acetyltransferase [Segetibacter sp.]|nr:ribosomal-protein-serine N-acetyltransferase [Segetibacter sp.]
MTEIQIRSIEKEDYLQLYDIIEKNRQRLLMYFPKTSNAITDIDTAKKYTQLKLRQALNREQFYFVMVLKTTSQIIGGIILKNIDWSVPKGELAYFIDEDSEGKGYTSYAVKWVTEHAFNDLKMEKLYIKFNPENFGSKKVAINNGFEKEGYMKREFRTGQGDLTDVERYGLLR